MGAFLSAESTMVVFGIAIAVGFALRKRGVVDDRFDAALSAIIVNVTCPALALDSVLSSTQETSSQSILEVLVISFATFAVIIAVAWLLPRLYRVPERSRGAHQFIITFGNTGFIGYAVLGAIMGKQAVLYAVIYNIAFNVLAFSAGSMMVISSRSQAEDDGEAQKLPMGERLRSLGKSLASPLVVSAVLALVLALLHVSDNSGIIGRTCSLLGQMTSPAAMLVIGSTLAKYDMRSMFNDVRAYLSSAGRLLVAPLLVLAVGQFMTADSGLLAALVLESGMPVATLGTIFCITYRGDLETMARCTFLTTVLSLVTIPILCAIVL